MNQEQWEKEIVYIMKKNTLNNVQSSDSKYPNNLTGVVLINLIRSLLHSQAEEVRNWAENDELDQRGYGNDGLVHYKGLMDFLSTLTKTK